MTESSHTHCERCGAPPPNEEYRTKRFCDNCLAAVIEWVERTEFAIKLSVRRKT